MSSINNVGPTNIPDDGVYRPVMPPPRSAAPEMPYPTEAAPLNSYREEFDAGDLTAVYLAGVRGREMGRRRGRGRPRKYGVAAPVMTPPTTGKRKGRPPGKKQNTGSSANSNIMTPHIIRAQAGEDVAAKILAYFQSGSKAISVLSANGFISNATIYQSPSSGGNVTYEGHYQISGIYGTYMVIEKDGQSSRVGGLSVLLSRANGRVFGGHVAGPLIAAAPVMVIIGSFVPNFVTREDLESKSSDEDNSPVGSPKPVRESHTNQTNSSNPDSTALIASK